MKALRYDSRSLFDPSWGEIDSRVRGPKFDEMRQKGLIAWSTVKWDTKEKASSTS